MKTFVKDYAELVKMTGKFYKNHWKGMIVMEVAAGAAGYAILCKDDIKNKVKAKFGKEEA